MMAFLRDEVYTNWVKRTRATLIKFLNTSTKDHPRSHSLIPELRDPNWMLPIADSKNLIAFLVCIFHSQTSRLSKSGSD